MFFSSILSQQQKSSIHLSISFTSETNFKILHTSSTTRKRDEFLNMQIFHCIPAVNLCTHSVRYAALADVSGIHSHLLWTNETALKEIPVEPLLQCDLFCESKRLKLVPMFLTTALDETLAFTACTTGFTPEGSKMPSFFPSHLSALTHLSHS